MDKVTILRPNFYAEKLLRFTVREVLAQMGGTDITETPEDGGLRATVPVEGGAALCRFRFPAPYMEVVLTGAIPGLSPDALCRTANELADRVLACLADEDRTHALLEAAPGDYGTTQEGENREEKR